MAFTAQPGVAQPGLFHPGNLESDTAAVTGADTFGTTAEAYTLAVALNGSDTASATEAQSIRVIALTDTGSGEESQSLAVTLNGSDTASGTEASAGSLSSSDDCSSEEEHILAVALTGEDEISSLEDQLVDDQSEDTPDGDDSGNATEDQNTSATLPGADEITVSEFQFIDVTLSSSDAASGVENVAFSLSGSDTAGSEETEDHEQVYIGEDSVSVAESHSIAVTLSSTDELHAVDTHRPFPAGPVDIGDYQVSLVMGPATVYVADFETLEPLDSEISSTPVGNWLDIGTTLDGVVMTVKHDFESPEVMQKYDKTASRLKRRHITVDMKMAEPTLINMLYALNSGELVGGSGYTSYSPPFLDRATPLTYRAVIIDGWAPGFSEVTGQHRRRRVILRKCLSTEDTSMSYTKDKLTAQNVTWTVHRVDGEIPPLKVIDEE